MSIAALESVSALSSLGTVAPSGYIDPTEGGGSAGASGSVSGAFGGILTDAVTNLQGLQKTSNDLAVKAVTGDLDDIHDYTIAATEAKVTLELTAAIRNKAVDAFNEIMRMQA